MQGIKDRFNYLFLSTRGLSMLAICMIALVSAVWGTLSGPLAELGVRDFMIDLLGMRILQAEREGRMIMLYHSIAMAVVAILVYFITGLIPMKECERVKINATVTVGYLMSIFFGLGFGYFNHNWIFHGLFITGQALVFWAGVLLAAALWPWRKEYSIKNKAYARTRNGLDLERTAFFVAAVALLGSSFFGAIAGMYYGNGFETFLAETTIREPHKTILQKSIIGHLHIMLALLSTGVSLVIGRWLDFKGIWQKMAMPLYIVGSIILTFGAWSVMVVEWAHTTIYVGSTFILLGALFLVIYGFGELIRSGLEKRGLRKANFFQRLAALVEDPLKFGSLWQMIFMNFTVSGVGIFMAVKLDELIRVWPFRDERILLAGHWHILATLTATIMLFYYADLMGLKGRARKIFGWSIIIFSDLAFASVTVFGMKRLFVDEASQQPVVDTLMILADLGLVIVLLALAAFLIWLLVDFFSKNGRWRKDVQIPAQEVEA